MDEDNLAAQVRTVGYEWCGWIHIQVSNVVFNETANWTGSIEKSCSWKCLAGQAFLDKFVRPADLSQEFFLFVHLDAPSSVPIRLSS